MNPNLKVSWFDDKIFLQLISSLDGSKDTISFFFFLGVYYLRIQLTKPTAASKTRFQWSTFIALIDKLTVGKFKFTN